jgi:hypothetical protein
MNRHDHHQKKWIGGWNFNPCQMCDVVDHAWSFFSDAFPPPGVLKSGT